MFPNCGSQSCHRGAPHLPCQWPDQGADAEAVVCQRQSYHLRNLCVMAWQEPPGAEDQAFYLGLQHPPSWILPAGEWGGGHGGERLFICRNSSGVFSSPPVWQTANFLSRSTLASLAPRKSFWTCPWWLAAGRVWAAARPAWRARPAPRWVG